MAETQPRLSVITSSKIAIRTWYLLVLVTPLTTSGTEDLLPTCHRFVCLVPPSGRAICFAPPLKMTLYLPLDTASPFPPSPSFLLPSTDTDDLLNRVIKAIMKAKRIVVVCGMILFCQVAGLEHSTQLVAFL
jgi:hypothetical protein